MSKETKSVTCYYPDGQKRYEEWWQDGVFHRDGGKPARIGYYPDGQVKCEEWWQDGRRHRDDGKPARIEYHPDGQVKREEWYQDGEPVSPLSRLYQRSKQ
ncbi:hypothetical protein HHJ78_02625 [Mobiluncus mulieris]|uniref:MORN repeat variant n=1 Tax=Mobiluncus mulieris TaxID=2052 RepID=A0A7Y0U005_9ACTO|nr:hypothetical protein [Mobiluncus mulieris]NMW64450.1 hypothetical protein [Mobiluncus mulieris]NMX11139.1 hypothetical protein [Mobiluncus mulieris]